MPLANNVNICLGNSITFSDISTGSPTSWTWDFGDGNSSTLQNPTHTYSSAGTYNVSLTVSDGASTDSETKTAFITVGSTVNTQKISPLVITTVGMVLLILFLVIILILYRHLLVVIVLLL